MEMSRNTIECSLSRSLTLVAKNVWSRYVREAIAHAPIRICIAHRMRETRLHVLCQIAAGYFAQFLCIFLWFIRLQAHLDRDDCGERKRLCERKTNLRAKQTKETNISEEKKVNLNWLFRWTHRNRKENECHCDHAIYTRSNHKLRSFEKN